MNKPQFLSGLVFFLIFIAGCSTSSHFRSNNFYFKIDGLTYRVDSQKDLYERDYWRKWIWSDLLGHKKTRKIKLKLTEEDISIIEQSFYSNKIDSLLSINALNEIGFDCIGSLPPSSNVYFVTTKNEEFRFSVDQTEVCYDL